jgi:hypothetical protein
MVLRVPDAYLDEYSNRLREKYKLEVSPVSLSRFLSSKGITRKKAFCLYFKLMEATKRSQRTRSNTTACLAQKIGEMASKSTCFS